MGDLREEDLGWIAVTHPSAGFSALAVDFYFPGPPSAIDALVHLDDSKPDRQRRPDSRRRRRTAGHTPARRSNACSVTSDQPVTERSAVFRNPQKIVKFPSRASMNSAWLYFVVSR